MEGGGRPRWGSWRQGRFRRSLPPPGGGVGLALTLGLVAAGLAAPWLPLHDPFALVGPSLHPPSAAHPFGTDVLGRDVLSGVFFGARTSLTVASGVGAVALALGLAVGGWAGWAGGVTDDVLMRATEFFQVIPRFFLAVVAVAFLGPGTGRLVAVLGLTSWAVLARVVRAEVLSLRERDFVLAARAGGASGAAILVRDVLPLVLPSALVVLGLVLGQVLLVEAALAFLGLGDPQAMSWGFQVSEAQPYLRAAWWTSVFPGLAIVAAVLGLNLLGDWLAGEREGAG